MSPTHPSPPEDPEEHHPPIPAPLKTHLLVLAVADLGQVQPCDHPQPRRQPLQQQPDDGGQHQHPQELRDTGTPVGGGTRGAPGPPPKPHSSGQHRLLETHFVHVFEAVTWPELVWDGSKGTQTRIQESPALPPLWADSTITSPPWDVTDCWNPGS